MNYPIIFIHKGNSSYLKKCVQQAKKSNPSSEIILIGDNNNQTIKGIIHFNIDNFSESATKFSSIYQHQSFNEYHFELFCYQRWFILNDFVKSQKIKCFWYVDSDVLIFEDLEVYLKTINSVATYDLIGYDVKKAPKELDIFMPAINLFKYKTLSSACEFIFKSYTKPKIATILSTKWKHHQKNKIAGGVCDMTHLYLFFLEKNYKSFHTFDINNECIVDGNINKVYNYDINKTLFKTINNKKLLQKSKGKFYLTLEDGRKKKVIASHFQGSAKSMIDRYSQNKFNLKLLVKRIIKRIIH